MTEAEQRRESVIDQCQRTFEAKTGLAGRPIEGGQAVACKPLGTDLQDVTDEKLIAELERRTL